MAFDVYVGTLTRYYRRDWETPGQRMAREMGVRHHVISPNGPPQIPPVEEVREIVLHWREALHRSMKPNNLPALDWREDDSQPYFSERPGWGGYTALLVWAAHAEHPDLPLPVTLPESSADDPAFQKSLVRTFKSTYRSILLPHLWLPVEFPLVFDWPTAGSEQPVCIGSTFTLRRQLEDLRSKTATRLEQLKLESTARAAEPPKPSGWFSRLRGVKPEPATPAAPDLAPIASDTLAMFEQLAAKACEHLLPMTLDY